MIAQDTSHAAASAQAPFLRSALLDWYDRIKRDLPWRRTRDPYAIWISETMLQQTRVDTVIPYYERFLARFPTVHALAEAPLDAVLASWSGLGYYRRARMLHAAAAEVASRHEGSFPREPEVLRTLSGVGRYTAGAVASIAFEARAALVDGNVARVYARFFAIESDVTKGEGIARIWSIAEAIVPSERPGDFNQALMELGATVCVPTSPSCLVCPLAEACAARHRGLTGRLPLRAPKQPPKERRLSAVVLSSGGEVLLARRSREGLFGGLWEPPLLEDEALAFAVLPPALRRYRARLAVVGALEHVLTHRRFVVTVHAARLPARAVEAAGRPIPESLPAGYDAIAWLPASDAERGQSSLAKRVLAAAEEALGARRLPRAR